VLVANGASGDRLAVPASPTDPASGRFRAEVVFPSSGTWMIAVDDGFPERECAQVHTFGTTTIAPAAPPPLEPPAPAPTAAAALPASLSADPANRNGDGPALLPAVLGAALGVAALGALVFVRARRIARPVRTSAET
jgi:hypothetical protein